MRAVERCGGWLDDVVVGWLDGGCCIGTTTTGGGKISQGGRFGFGAFARRGGKIFSFSPVHLRFRHTHLQQRSQKLPVRGGMNGCARCETCLASATRAARVGECPDDDDRPRDLPRREAKQALAATRNHPRTTQALPWPGGA